MDITRTNTKLALLLCVVSGCTNAPGALEFRIVPQKQTFYADEPVRLDAILTAHGGRVCLALSDVNAFRVELTSQEELEDINTQTIAYCGTNWRMLLLPLYTVVVGACFLDVADVMRRFDVIEDGKERTYHLELAPLGDGIIVLHQDVPAYVVDLPGEMTPLKPGAYRVRATFQSQSMDIYPAPLFWTVYDHPVASETQFVIQATSADD